MTKKEFMEAWDWEHEADEGIYDLENGVFYFLDYSYGEDDNPKLWGTQSKEISASMMIALVELGCENITQYLLETYPAPGTGVEERLDFYGFDSIEEAWEYKFKDIADNLYTETRIVKAIRGEN